MAKILRKSLAFFFDLLHLGNNLRVLYLRVEALVYLFLYKVRAYKYKIKLTMTHCNKKTTKAEIILFLSKIQLKWPESNLVRIGPKDDGGYVLPDDFDGVVANFSPGVGGVVGFEEELASMGIRSFMIDASVEKLPVENAMFHFESKFLGDKTDGIFISLADWISSHALENGNDGDLILSMDIEGGEYPVLLNVGRDTLEKFRYMTVEFHDLHLISQRGFYQELILIFEKLLDVFEVVNIHPNNYNPIIKYKGIKVPPVLEFTFVRKDRISKVPKNAIPNLRLNSKNNKYLPDITLPSTWFA